MKTFCNGMQATIAALAAACAGTLAPTVAAAAPAGGNVTPTLSVTGTRSANITGILPGAAFGPVTFLNEKDGWVVGSQGVDSTGRESSFLWRTRDGGQKWQRISLHGDGSHIGNLQFVSPTTGFAVSDLGQASGRQGSVRYAVLRTTDGGESWVPVWQGTAPSISWGFAGQPEISLRGRTGGIAIAGRLLLSHDGGETWVPASFPWSGFQPNDVSFTTPENGIVIGVLPLRSGATQTDPNPEEVLVARTMDGGKHWSRSYVIPPSAGNPFGSLSVSFANQQDGWFFVDNLANMAGSLYRTSDSGLRWQKVQTKLTVGRIVPEHMQFTSPTTGWLPVSSGAAPFPGGIEVITDGGKQFHTYGTRREWNIVSIALVSSTDGWATGIMPGYGNEGYLLHTTDGGRTFTQVLPALSPTVAVSFGSVRTGFGIGAASSPFTLLRSDDGGRTWRAIGQLPFQTSPIGLSFANAAVGWVVFVSNTLEETDTTRHALQLWVTRNGGRTWVTRAIDLNYPPYSVVDATQVRIWSLRQAGIVPASYPDLPVAFTADSGGRWQESVIAVQGGGVFSVSFAAPGDTWVVMGGSGEGVTLNRVRGASLAPFAYLPDAQWPGGITFSNAQDGWVAVTKNNPLTAWPEVTVYRTDAGGRSWRAYRFPKSFPWEPLPGQNTAYMDSVGNQNVWLLTGYGLLRSTDGGLDWTWL